MGLKRRNPARTLLFTVPDMLFDMVRPEIAPEPAVPVTPSPSREERRRMIAVAAYAHAERQGFSGDPVEHWLRAEREIDARFEQRLAS